MALDSKYRISHWPSAGIECSIYRFPQEDGLWVAKIGENYETAYLPYIAPNGRLDLMGSRPTRPMTEEAISRLIYSMANRSHQPWPIQSAERQVT